MAPPRCGWSPEMSNIPSRATIAIRLASKRNRKIVVAHLNACAQDCLAVGRRDAAGDVLALADLYGAAEHPYHDADKATKTRWRHLSAPQLVPIGTGD